jgi:hypothetical protein
MPHQNQGPRIRDKIRFLKETSQRSGFDNFDRFGNKRWTGIKDVRSGVKSAGQQGTVLVSPEEFDTPPPSEESLGGADISGTPRTNSDTTDIPIGSEKVVLVITAAGGINLNQEPVVLFAGTNASINISANPQISRGKATQIKAFQCVSNEVILDDGDGLAMAGSKAFVMTSGSIWNAMYDGTDNLWRELSRGIEHGSLGDLC